MKEEIIKELSKKYNKKEEVIKILLVLNKEKNGTYNDSKQLIERFFKINAINNAVGEWSKIKVTINKIKYDKMVFIIV